MQPTEARSKNVNVFVRQKVIALWLVPIWWDSSINLAIV